MANKWEKFVRSFITNEGYKSVLNGLGNTFQIAFFGFLIGLVLGIIISSVKIAEQHNKPAKALAKAGNVYVAFFRGTPIVVQLLLV